MAAQNDFLALHLNREHFAQEVSNALREDLGTNGFTLESVTITELAEQNRIMREGKAQQEEAAVKAKLAKSEAIETRDLQRQAAIAVEL